jgi:hypothetical protein
VTWTVVGIAWCLSAAVVVTYIAVSEYLDNRWKRALKRSVREGIRSLDREEA